MTELRYLLDANSLIYLLERRSGPLVARVEAEPFGSIATSCIAFAEVMVGVLRQGETAKRVARALFVQVRPLPFTEDDALAFACLPFKRAARFDRLIAAQALTRDLAVVTNNQRDFQDIEGLRVENWTA